MTAIRTRFAPSPTGSLHVGGVRTALYAMVLAHAERGAFVLRIEDTDRVRSTDEAAKGIVEDLRWLGLNWDEGPERDHPQYGPYYQSDRLSIYTRHAEELLAAGHAYEAWETPAELDAERKTAESAKQNYRYHRRTHTDAEVAAFRAEGRKPVLRLAAPGHAVTVQDIILGDVTVEADGLDDFVIVKADGYPTYHFAVVIDDHHMDIDLVVRGQEHLMNTHKHFLIYEAFGWTPPKHGHLPLIFNPTGQKMSKRDKARVARESARALAKKDGLGDAWNWLAERASSDLDDVTAFMAKKHDKIGTSEAIARALGVTLPMIEVMDFRLAGYLPEAMLNYLALLGWSAGDDREIWSVPELVSGFAIERVIKTAARFDPDKLAWMNAEYMKALPEDTLLEHLAQWLAVVDSPIGALDADKRRQLIAMYRPRARTFVDLDRLAAFLFAAPTEFAQKQVKKHLDNGGWDRLLAARAALADLPSFTADGVGKALEALCTATGEPIGKVAQPLRIAVSGDGVSPEVADTLAFLGPAETLGRIDRFLKTRT